MDELDLLDWKRRVFGLYAAVRAEADPDRGWELWRTTRNELFASHPQSPLTAEQRTRFDGLPYFDYDPGLRVLADVEPAERVHRDIATSGSTPYPFTRFAHARFELGGEAQSLDLYWLEAYGGGIYLCFADGTSGGESYHAGRYLLDTVKGSDLGGDAEGRLVLDFNFAYNPSCSYDPRWVCPLAPPGNRLELPVRGGERQPPA
jgi:hypothetical protein